MINFLLSSGKVQSENGEGEQDAESEEEEEEEEWGGSGGGGGGDGKGEGGSGEGAYEDEDDDLRTYSEHLNPKSFSWTLMRYGVVRLSFQNILDIMEVIGVELNELAILSPMAYEAVRSLERWSELLKNELNLFDGPPENYLVELGANGLSGHNRVSRNGMQQMLINPKNTPFE